jgi:hypothetical protein
LTSGTIIRPTGIEPPGGEIKGKLNMATTTAASGAPSAPTNVFARFIGIITSPGATFASVAEHPKWLGIALIIGVLFGVFSALPMTTPEGKAAYIDQSVQAMQRFGMEVNDDMTRAFEKAAERAPITTAVTMLFGPAIGAVIVAGILFAIFNGAMGGTARFKQLYAVVLHSFVISALGAAFNGPVNYARGTLSSSVANLGALMPGLDETSFIGKLLGAVDFFTIWWLIVLAIGLAVLYRRKTQPIAITLFGIYAVIAIGVAAIMSRG